MCIFGLWEEGGEAGENPHKHGNKNTHLPYSVANRLLTIGVKIFVIQARSGDATPVRSMIRNAATFIPVLQVLWDRSAHHLVPITATLLPSPTIWVSFIIALVAAVIFIGLSPRLCLPARLTRLLSPLLHQSCTPSSQGLESFMDFGF